MAGSYIIKNGAPVSGGSPTVFFHTGWSRQPLFVLEDGPSYWRTVDHAGPSAPYAPCPLWAARLVFAPGLAPSTEAEIWVYPNNSGNGNTKLTIFLSAGKVDTFLGITVTKRTGSSEPLDGGPSPAVFTFGALPTSEDGNAYASIFFGNGDVSVRDDAGTILFSVAWADLAYLLGGTIGGGDAAAFNPALSVPWVLFGEPNGDGPKLTAVYDLFYGGWPSGGAPTAFWTSLVGALETP